GLARELHQLFADLGQVHAPVPPTVTWSMRTVGRPTPTGTIWPSLPQVPRPGSCEASLPTALTFLSASGPTPMIIAPFTGRVISLSSIRSASLIQKPKLPLEMPPCPPPNCRQ